MPFKIDLPLIEFQWMMPLIILAVSGMLALLLDLWRPNQKNDSIVILSVFGLVAAIVAVFGNASSGAGRTAGGFVTFDAVANVGSLAVCAGALIVTLFSEPYLRNKRIPFGEFYPLLLWSAMGGVMMVSTENLLVLFIGLEILSISLYVMAGMSRGEATSEESAMKYFLLGAFATCFLLMGIAFLYGATGKLDYSTISSFAVAPDEETKLLMVIGFALVTVGLGFKASLVPFHTWTPDVYQGAPTNVTAYMATGAKAAAFMAMFRFVSSYESFATLFIPALTVIAILTMTLGNLMGLREKNLKRLFAFSSIANAGYVFIGIIAHAKSANLGLQSVAFYVISYTVITAGIFGILSLLAKGGKEGTTIDDLRGLASQKPFAAFCLSVFILSLIGLPPLPGFFGKILLFNDALKAEQTGLAIALAISSVISVGYYFPIISALYAKQDAEDEVAGAKLAKVGPLLQGTFVVCLVGGLLITFMMTPLMTALGVR